MSDKTKELNEIGQSAFESIKCMIDAYDIDYDRLEELKGDRDDWDDTCETCDGLGVVSEDESSPDDCPECDGSGHIEWAKANPDEADELKELEASAGDCENQDDALQRIQEDPLSVEVRSGWTTPGETMTAEEFCILLTTGGPAVRIIGDMDENGEPDRARLEVQDWGTPWTEYFNADSDVLLQYCQLIGPFGQC